NFSGRLFCRFDGRKLTVYTEQLRDEDRTPVGRVRTIHGSEVRLGLPGGKFPTRLNDNNTPTVGKFVGVPKAEALVVGMIREVSVEVPLQAREEGCSAVATVDLMGELTQGENPDDIHFHHGVSHYPEIGDPAF